MTFRLVDVLTWCFCRRSRSSGLGARGEDLAAQWLKKRGYRILKRNLTLGDDEADIIALDPGNTTLVLVEVKTRRSETPAPHESIGHVKQFRLARTAARLQQRSGANRPVRFDAITIIWPDGEEPRITHWPSAFDSPF